MKWLALIALALLLSAALLAGWRTLDRKSDRNAWNSLVDLAGPARGHYDPATIISLPEPAQRYFRYTIRPGAALHGVVEIEMRGEMGLGTKDQPNYRAMTAQQVLVPPYGLVWKLEAGPISGSDAAMPDRSWTRFWLFGVLPIVRVSGSEDHRRSAFGRVVAEGAFWAPASLLPGDTVRWEPLDNDSARAIVTFAGFEQAVEITVADDGRPTRVVIQRWSNENPAKVFREQPFGGDLSDFRDFGGYRLPTKVEGGNHIGTDNYFPFFKAEVAAIRFPSEAC
ncbi:MAG: DUF6544 family protein [Xanthomonadales bacterium]|jgi:hypothetical protein|nr:DUF6544 family protein [Xanthomonadales bacterium]